MKIRQGFVSNSSSSSFVLQVGQKFSTVKEVAKYILNICISEWGTDISLGNFEKELIELDKINSDTPVFFNTVGDYTYIRKMDNVLVITTTQNIDIPDISNFRLKDHDLSDDFYHQFDYIDKYMDIEEEIIIESIEDLDNQYKFSDFYSLQYGIYGRHDYLNNCPNCGRSFSRAFKLKNGNVICNCQVEKYAKSLIRKNKLKEINGNNNSKKE